MLVGSCKSLLSQLHTHILQHQPGLGVSQHDKEKQQEPHNQPCKRLSRNYDVHRFHVGCRLVTQHPLPEPQSMRTVPSVNLQNACVRRYESDASAAFLALNTLLSRAKHQHTDASRHMYQTLWWQAIASGQPERSSHHSKNTLPSPL